MQNPGPYLVFVLSRQNVRQQYVPEPSRRIMEMHVCIGYCFDEHLNNVGEKKHYEFDCFLVYTLNTHDGKSSPECDNCPGYYAIRSPKRISVRK